MSTEKTIYTEAKNGIRERDILFPKKLWDVADEVVHKLNVCPALKENPGSVPSTHME